MQEASHARVRLKVVYERQFFTQHFNKSIFHRFNSEMSREISFYFFSFLKVLSNLIYQKIFLQIHKNLVDSYFFVKLLYVHTHNNSKH